MLSFADLASEAIVKINDQLNALRAVPSPRAWPHMIHRPRRPAAVGAAATPAVEDVLPEAQLRRSLRSQVDAIDVMVCHAPGAASRLRLPEVDKLTSDNSQGR